MAKMGGPVFLAVMDDDAPPLPILRIEKGGALIATAAEIGAGEAGVTGASGVPRPRSGLFYTPVVPAAGYVDSKGNAIPTPLGGKFEGSKDGRFIRAKGPDGKPTGIWIDGPHKPSTHTDPRAQQPHGHVPGVTNDAGTPWLPIKQ